MSPGHFETLKRTGKLPGTGKTSTSRVRAYSEQYDGVTVEFKTKAGTTEALENIGVRDQSVATKAAYPDMPEAKRGWGSKNARFKAEGNQTTIALGRGRALDIFNKNIVSFKEVSRRKC